MNTNKPLMVAGLIAAISMGSVGVAEASTHSTHSTHTVSSSTTTPTVAPVDPDIAVLAKLVAAGTITQAQSTVILAALEAAHPARPTINGGAPGQGDNGEGPENHGPGGRGFGGINIQKDLAVVTSTLGITSAQLQTDLKAGQSLATIAGTKTAALISALVAAETTNINARVTAGTLTQAQATTLIAGLQAAVTAVVNATPGAGGFGHGMGGGHGFTPGAGAPSVAPSTSGSN